MAKVELDLLSSGVNVAVVQLPTRKFPGAVIQGDSLKILSDLANSIAARLSGSDDVELLGDANELASLLMAQVLYYEQTLAKQGLPLPYVSKKVQ